MLKLPPGFYRTHRACRDSGFSLIEILAASVVFLLLLGIILKMTQATADTWSSSTGKTESYRDARTAFSTMSRAVSQATLNPYFDYADASGNFRDGTSAPTFIPKRYTRRSDLHFLTGKSLLDATVDHPITHAIFFQAPLGYTQDSTLRNLDSFLNACGFYVYYGDDPTIPAHLSGVIKGSKYRFRLMQFLQPTEDLAIYDSSVTGGSANWRNDKWFADTLAQPNPPVSQVAENVIALIILPKYSSRDTQESGNPLSTNYEYDSRDATAKAQYNQLCPVLEMIMVVIDEVSAMRLGNTATPPDFGFGGLFQDPAKIEQDLSQLELNIGAKPGNSSSNKIPLRYQIFRTDIALRGTKWSGQ